MISAYLFQTLICIIFLGLLWGISKIISHKFKLEKNNSGKKNIEIIERQMIAKDASLVLVEIESQRLLLGVSGQAVSLILPLDKNGKCHDQN